MSISNEEAENMYKQLVAEETLSVTISSAGRKNAAGCGIRVKPKPTLDELDRWTHRD